MSGVTVIDYGASNLLNVVRALEHCGAKASVTDTPPPVAQASKLIFPGVGTFGDCMMALKERGLIPAIREYIAKDKPFLGICVGMQVMFDAGEEFGEHEGLGIIPGRVVRIPAQGTGGRPHKIPHIGWSALHAKQSWKDTPLAPLEGKGASVYFVHSYMGAPSNASHRLADADYNGVTICAAVRRGNAYGCQFHPEKSGEAGLSILKRFLEAA